MRLLARLFACVLVALASLGCSVGFSARTARRRRALDDGDPHRALDALDRELRVDRSSELPPRLAEDDALLVLDRATIQHAVAALDDARRDYETADEALEMLDLSRGTADEIGRWVFSDASGRYTAPAHEKLLVHALDMAAYLEEGDLSGARVEARRLAVVARFLRERGGLEARGPREAFALGALLAAFTFEKSGDADEARVWYEDAGAMRFERVDGAPSAPASDDDGEILLVVGWGRVPHRVARRVPIGEALTRASREIAPHDREQAGNAGGARGRRHAGVLVVPARGFRAASLLALR